MVCIPHLTVSRRSEVKSGGSHELEHPALRSSTGRCSPSVYNFLNIGRAIDTNNSQMKDFDRENVSVSFRLEINHELDPHGLRQIFLNTPHAAKVT